LINSLIELATNSGVEVYQWNFEYPVRAIYISLTGCKPTIGYCPCLEWDARLFREVFSEELGHHFAAAGRSLTHTCYADRLQLSITEYRARRWGAEFLMPISNLITVIESGIDSNWELADHFVVNLDFLEFRLSLPDFQNYLITRR